MFKEKYKSSSFSVPSPAFIPHLFKEMNFHVWLVEDGAEMNHRQPLTLRLIYKTSHKWSVNITLQEVCKRSKQIDKHADVLISCVRGCRPTWAWPWWAFGGTCARWGPSECPGWSARGSGEPCESPPQAGGTRSLHLWMGRSNGGDSQW